MNRQELINQTADMLVSLIEPNPDKPTNYYLMNRQHVLVDIAIKKYAKKYNKLLPLSDKERFIVELSLLNDKALQKFAELLEAKPPEKR